MSESGVDIDDLKNRLIGLYLNVKIRPKDTIYEFTKDQLENEYQTLRETPIITLIDYIT